MLNWVSDHPLPSSSSACLSCRADLSPTSDDPSSATVKSADKWPVPNEPASFNATGEQFEHFKRGCDLSDTGNFRAALSALDEAIRLAPDYLSAYVRRGYVYLNLEQYNQAIEDFDRAINIDPNSPEAYKYHGAVYSELGQYESASKDFMQAFMLERRSVDTPTETTANESSPTANATPVGTRPNDAQPAGRAIPSMQCPRCSTVNEPGSTFCYQCGLPLDDESARSPRPAATNTSTPYQHQRSASAIYSKPVGFRPPNTLANWTQVLLGISLVVFLLWIAVIISEIDLLGRIEAGEFVSASEIEDNDNGKAGIAGIAGFAIFLTAIPFLMWVYRAAENLREFNRRELQFEPGWTVGWWFIPIAQYFKPYQTMREISKASDPSVALNDPTGWNNSRVPPTLKWWWAAWLAYNGLFWISSMIAYGNATAGELITSDQIQIAAIGFLIAAGVLLFVIVRSITSLQNETQAKLIQQQFGSEPSQPTTPTYQNYNDRPR